MPIRTRRALLLFTAALDQARQQRLMFKWALDRGYTTTSVTHVPADAAALAEAGLVDVVVVVRHTKATLEAAGRIGQTPVTIDEIRPSSTPLGRQGGLHGQILDAAGRNVPAEAIAAVLDVPVSTVHEVLGVGQALQPVRASTSSGRRRPRLVLVGPPGRP